MATSSPFAKFMSAKILSIKWVTISSAVFNSSLCVPGSPWMPIPISISFSSKVKFGLPAAGTVHGVSAIPILLTLFITFSATALTSSSVAPVSALAPANLWTNIVPAIPLLPIVHVLFSTATSSSTITESTLIPSISAISLAISKFITSPV